MVRGFGVDVAAAVILYSAHTESINRDARARLLVRCARELFACARELFACARGPWTFVCVCARAQPVELCVRACARPVELCVRVRAASYTALGMCSAARVSTTTAAGLKVTGGRRRLGEGRTLFMRPCLGRRSFFTPACIYTNILYIYK